MSTIYTNRLIKFCIGLTFFVTANSCTNNTNEGTSSALTDKSTWGDEKIMNEKLDSLMSRMTLNEKIGQTVLYSSGWEKTGPTLDENYVQYLKSGMLGGIFNAFTADYTYELQKIAVEETRLGIPLLFGYDVIHGHRTIFPIPLAEAASWDMDMIEKTAQVAAAEASAEGIHWTFAPMVDIARDPRWGRMSEGAGEDVFLGTEIAKRRISGFQGSDLSLPNTILACAKHYAAYGAAQAGRDYHTVDISERELRDTYLPPFKASVESGVATFMTSFNEIAGVPSSGSKFLLDDILRKEWGFEGFVVTDYTSINEMIPHGFSRDEKHSAEQAINAGVEMDMQGGVFLNHLETLIKEGKVSEERLNQAVRRILEMKYRLGLFDDPYRYCNQKRQDETIYKKEHLDLARDMARKSIVLLKNENQTLPLSKDKKIALIGPLAKDDSNIIGAWAAQGDRSGKAMSVYEGLIDVLGDDKSIIYSMGCEITGEDKSQFGKAIATAKRADVVVMVLGESEYMSGEAASRTNLNLPGVQQELLKAIIKIKKPVVLILMNGRPLTLEFENEVSDAILEAWWPGTMGGGAIADIIFGDYNPSAKLPVTFPRNVGQIPIFYNMKNTGRPYQKDNSEQRYLSRYLDVDNSPLYSFGYGLSYSNFEYDNLRADKVTIGFGETLHISVDVLNSGDYDGEEIVQLYIRDKVGSVTRPVKELKGFEKIGLKKGEKKTVKFEISSNDLRFHTIDMEFVAESGEFEFFVGRDSNASLKEVFQLID